MLSVMNSDEQGTVMNKALQLSHSAFYIRKITSFSLSPHLEQGEKLLSSRFDPC